MRFFTLALGRGVLYAPVAPPATGCAVQMTNGSSVAQNPQIAFFGKPAAGEFQNQSWVPNTPIHSWAGPGADILGYTRNVVALAGVQQGGKSIIVAYNGLECWIDGTKIAPFHGAPGQRRIVPGRDLLQRPILEID